MNDFGAMPSTVRPEYFFTDDLQMTDPDLFSAIDGELDRQRYQIELIASENIVSKAVMQAQGSVLTNKYAEGYPGRRYYQGCQHVDVAEQLAMERARALFDCEYINVQPHSGAQANGAVMMALLKPGDTILGMSLAAGGHLTHGAPPAQSGKWFNAVQYGVRREDGQIDFDEVESLAKEHSPKMIIAGGLHIREKLISSASVKLPILLARTCWWTWRISPGSSRAVYIQAHFHTHMWLQRQRTKPCVGPEGDDSVSRLGLG